MLLFPKNFCSAPAVAEGLCITQSNVSISPKKPDAWQPVKLACKPGEQHEHRPVLSSLWNICKAVAMAKLRHEREITHIVTAPHAALLDLSVAESERHASTRIHEGYGWGAESADHWFDQLQRLSLKSTLQLMNLGSAVQKLPVLKNGSMAALTRTGS